MTQPVDSATPKQEVSEDASDALLRDVDFGDEAPPPGQQSGDSPGQSATGDVAPAGGDQVAPSEGKGKGEGEGEGEPRTYTQAEHDTAIEETKRETQSARDSEFDTMKNRMDAIEEAGQSSAIDLAEKGAVEDVTATILQGNPSLTHNEATNQASVRVRQARRQWEGEQTQQVQAQSLETQATQLRKEGESLASQKLKLDYGLTDVQTAEVLKIGNADSMKVMASLYKENNAATKLTDKTNQDSRVGIDLGSGSGAGDIVPDVTIEQDDPEGIMDVSSRDGTLSEKLSQEMLAEGWTP